VAVQVGILGKHGAILPNLLLCSNSSGFVEGLNNKLKLIKRRAFGYRNFEHFRLRVLWECDGASHHTIAP
jgi:transposase